MTITGSRPSSDESILIDPLAVPMIVQDPFESQLDFITAFPSGLEWPGTSGLLLCISGYDLHHVLEVVCGNDA